MAKPRPFDPQYPLLCKGEGCSQYIWLPQGILADILGDPLGRPKIQYPAIAVVCPHCKQLQTLSKDQFVAGHMEGRYLDVATEFYTLLQCDEEKCSIQVPLYVQWKAPTFPSTEAELFEETDTWKWGDLRCAAGHSIVKPPHWPLVS